MSSMSNIITQTLTPADRAVISRMGDKHYTSLSEKAKKLVEKANKFQRGLTQKEREVFLEIPFFIRRTVIDEVTLNRI